MTSHVVCPEMNEPLTQVREFTVRNARLCKSHHFVFDLPQFPDTNSCDYVVMGLNPGESSEETQQASNGTVSITAREQTSEHPLDSRATKTRSAKGWETRVKNFLDTSEVYATQLFFWSSSDLKHLEERYGNLRSRENMAVMAFCADMNRVLFLRRKPKAVILTGSDYDDIAKTLYALKLVETTKYRTAKNLEFSLVHMHDGERPWFVVPHLSGAWGFTNEIRREMSSYIRANLG
jgi:hypothetical protein